MTATIDIDVIRITRNLRTAFIRLPQVEAITTRLHQLRCYRCGAEEPEHVLVVGEPGVGKSTLLKRFAKAHRRVQHEEFTEIPVLYVEVPAACSIKKLAGEMLKSMGSPYWSRGDEAERTHQLQTLLRGCKTQLVILDEVNHLADRGAFKTHYAVGDWIKQLIDQSRVAFVLAGVPSVRELVMTNDQLQSRFGETLDLQSLSLSSVDEAQTFKRALRSLQKLLGSLDSVDLTSDTICKQIATATGGRLRAIRKLLVRAVELAVRSDPPCLSQETLSNSFAEVIFHRVKKERNPFHQDFNGQPLVLIGEPYAPRPR